MSQQGSGPPPNAAPPAHSPPADAIAACRARIADDPADTTTRSRLIDLLREAGRLEEALAECRALTVLQPGNVDAWIALGGMLIDLQRPVEAEAQLNRGLAYPARASAKAAIHMLLGLAQRRQRRDAEALRNYDLAYALDPTLPELDIHRAEAFQNLRRYEDAIATYRQAIAREPHNPDTHRHYNDLLYRLGRTGDFLKSYELGPRTPALLMGKAQLLNHQSRFAEAYVSYGEALARDPGNVGAMLGAVESLRGMKRYDEAAEALGLLLRHRGDDPFLVARAAEVALLQRDPKTAATLCERGLRAAPYDQSCLVGLSLAWRMLGDARDEILSGYDRYIRAFDLKAPDGFSSMADFNAELSRYLDALHPDTREYINQSLRGGTQTPDHVFGVGHELIDRLERRIAEAVQTYIAGLEGHDAHPLVSRRAQSFLYRGSRSSQLKANGFHVNHVHPHGWISSCYYVAVPDAAQDMQGRQGWIKFGEPGLDVSLDDPIRRMVQPVPGRLVLFPSYMWHGTVPFRDDAKRTTIAFDVIPQPAL